MSLPIDPLHPGEVLAGLYLAPLGMSAIALAARLDAHRTPDRGPDRDHGRYRHASGPLLLDHPGILDEPPARLGSGARPRDRRCLGIEPLEAA